MAKLKGVEVIEIKRLLYKGEEYSHVEDMPEIGDIIRVDGSWNFLKDGDMFICAELDASGDAVSSKGHCNYREHYDVFRKVSTTSTRDIKTEKRRAKPGERILITSASGTGGYYENGDILTVKKPIEFLEVYVEEFSDTYIIHSEYEVIDDESVDAEFKKGDKARVVSIADNTMRGFHVGEIVTVNPEGLSSEQLLIIEHETSVGYANPENLAKIESISVGDYAKVVGDTYYDDIKAGEYVKVTDEKDYAGDFSIERLDGSDYDYAQESSLERVELSDNDVAFLKIGRKIGEYKAGDIVRVIGDNAVGSRNMDGDIGVVDDDDGLLKVVVPSRSDITRRNCYHSAKSLELIAPVEARVDKVASQ